MNFLVALLLILALAAPAAARTGVTFLEDPGTGCGPENVEGWEFQTTTAITVSALGAYDFELDGMQFPTPVGLFDSSCKLVASATVPAGTSAALIEGFRYVGIAPVTLTAGATYRIAAVMHCDDFTPDFVDTEAFSIDSALTAVQTRRAGGESDLVCPTMTTPGFYGFGANFIIGEACGNGVRQGDEQCDDGNPDGRDCCSPNCTFEDPGIACAADGHDCTDDVCDGAGICTHEPSPPSTLCRLAEGGECDVEEHCDGESLECPPDMFEPNDTPCTDDETFCNGNETCQSGACTSSGNPCGTGTCVEADAVCLTPTPTVTSVPSSTSTATATRTATATVTPTASTTRSATASSTAVNSATATRTPAITPTRTASTTGTIGATRTATVTSAATATSAGTATETATSSTAVPSTTPTDTPRSSTCAGDCDGNGSVSVGELVTGVNIALSSQGIDRCRAFDTSGNDRVEISELVAAVNRALNGCA